MSTKNYTIIYNKNSFLFLLLISSFGPYVFPSYGIRLEHIIIYSYLIFLLLNNSIRIKINVSIFILLFSLIFFVAIPFFGYALLDKTISNALTISQFENYLQPLSLVLLCLSALHAYSYHKIKDYFHSIMKVFVILMAIHAIFILIFVLLFPDMELLRLFTGDRVITELSWETSMNASELSASVGRYSGVFTQIFEAGYAYSMALISWAYLVNNNPHFIRYKHVVLLVLCLGGFMTFSKVFLVLGMVSFALIIRNTLLWRYLTAFFLLFIAFYLYNLEIFTKGSNYLIRLIFMDESISIFDIYTSGRFTKDSTVLAGMGDIILNSPFFGYGYGSIKTSDFSLYEVVSLGGLIGVLVYLFLFILLLFINAKIKDRAIRRYYFYILIITILTSMSAPVITANRVSIVFWILTSFIVMLHDMQFKKSKRVI